MSSILPEKVFEATGSHPFVGQLCHPGDIDKGDTRIIDNLPLDYSILEEVDYKYPANNAYFAYMTRGCINHCSFCAVPTLEPNYCDYIGIKEQIEKATQRFGEQRDLLLLDNNVLASARYEQIIDEIRACGFEKGAHWVAPNQYQIAINNLKDNYNNRAYTRKCISLYKELMQKLSDSQKGDFYILLEENGLLSVDTATRDAILSIDSKVAPLFEKCYSSARPKMRSIDFNQGMDARLITDQNMKKLSTVCIRPLRIAFDHGPFLFLFVKVMCFSALYCNREKYLPQYYERVNGIKSKMANEECTESSYMHVAKYGATCGTTFLFVFGKPCKSTIFDHCAFISTV